MSFPFGSLEDLVVAAAEAVRPPERLTVPQAAEKYRKLNNKGAYVGPWKNSMVPYMVEPMNILTDMRYTGMIFVGPSQCGKTEIYLNWHTYTVVCDPTDMMLIEASQGRAADFSKRRIDRLHRDTPDVKERLIRGRNYDNTFDKRYRSGAMVTLSWPTVNELSGKPIPRLFLTDYDRMDQNIEGEGSPFLLAQARSTSFRRYGMTVAESSPSFPITDPRWSPSTPHEAPPCEGIIGLYNEGDLKWDTKAGNLSRMAKSVYLECPHCRARYQEGGGDNPGKHEMNQRGFWLKDGEKVTPDGEVIGEAIEAEARTASFWLKGVCAAFSEWDGLLLKLFNAERTYERTGAEEGLQTVMNTGFSLPYLPKAMQSERVPEALKERARDYGYKTVPANVRFLVAAQGVGLQKDLRQKELPVLAIGERLDRVDLPLAIRVCPLGVADVESVDDPDVTTLADADDLDHETVLLHVDRRHQEPDVGRDRLVAVVTRSSLSPIASTGSSFCRRSF